MSTPSAVGPRIIKQVAASAALREKVRRVVVNQLGNDRMRALHRHSFWLDMAAVLGVPAAFLLNGSQLGGTPFSITFVGRLLIQAVLLLWIAYLMHELTHRRWAGDRASRALAWIFGTPVLYVAGIYAQTHSEHHRWLGGASDLVFPRFFDKRWKRVLLLTPIGFVLGSLARSYNTDDAAKEHPSRTAEQCVQVALFFGAWVIIVFLAIHGVALVSFGFLLPLLTAVPVLNAIRLVLEHAETSSDLGAHCGTYYRTGMITQFVFMAGVGDCHLVHHLFPSIPFYRMPKAIKELRPILTELGVLERRSLPRILIAYFLCGEGYGTLWKSLS